MTIGILSLQGNFNQHRLLLQRIASHASLQARLVRSTEELRHCHGLILPGGESTTIGVLLDKAALFLPLQRAAAAGFPLFGVCAGAILLAKRVLGGDQRTLGLLDVDVERNGYGRQLYSFEEAVPLTTEADGGGARVVSGVFVRAPIIRRCGPGIQVLARYRGDAVVVREGAMLAATFHPELKGETALHTLFVAMCRERRRLFADYGSG